jgi:GTP cyclohydrolase II
VQLLTNNPQKLSAMEKAGIRVTRRVPLVSPTGAHNHAYIEAKAHKAGHLF